MKVTCSLYKKLRKNHQLNKEDIRAITEIAKKELKFLVNKNIPLSPQNYQKWFRVFCYLRDTHQELTEDDIFENFKHIVFSEEDKQVFENEDMQNITKEVISTLKNEMEEVINNVENYQEGIIKHHQKFQEVHKGIDDQTIKQMLEKILQELEELKEQNNNFKKKIEKQSHRIEKLEDELNSAKQEANTDFLTGLFNRKSFERALEDSFKDYKEKNYPFSFCMLDIDHFKNINDTYGHPFGDEVLKEIAQILKTYLRAKDIPGRIGGEEFGIIFPGIELQDAVKVVERLRKIIENRGIPIDDNIVNITASFGVIEMNDSINSPAELVREADELLYKAKKNGRNRVEYDTQLVRQ